MINWYLDFHFRIEKHVFQYFYFLKIIVLFYFWLYIENNYKK